MQLPYDDLNRLADLLAGRPEWTNASSRLTYIRGRLWGIPHADRVTNQLVLAGAPRETAEQTLQALINAGEVAPGQVLLALFLERLAADVVNYSDREFVKTTAAGLKGTPLVPPAEKTRQDDHEPSAAPPEVDIESFHAALLSAFPSRSDLSRMLRFGLNVRLDEITGSGGMNDVVFDVISWAESRNLLVELLEAARSANPGNPLLNQVHLESFAAPMSKGIQSIVRWIWPRVIPPEIEKISANQEAIRRLVEQLQSPAGVVPFVGAGLSIPLGMRGWTDFLLTQAEEAGVRDEIASRLARWEYEEAAEDLEAELTPFAFNAAIEGEYGDHRLAGDALCGPVLKVPLLTDGPVLTTNFDRALEMAAERADKPFHTVVAGAKPDAIGRLLAQQRRGVVKLHGDWGDRTDRVLTRKEYDEQYGAAGVDLTKRLPSLLQAILVGKSLLFLGCSLNQDRTVGTLGKVVEVASHIVHYAVLERPAEPAALREKRQFLGRHNILPIWYPAGRHDLIDPLLEFLVAACTGKQR